MAWKIRLSVVCDVRAPYTGVNFSGIFLHHVVPWSSGNSPTKNHEDRPRALQGGRKKVAIFDQYLAIARKRLKIDGYMLRCVSQALNPLFIHVTFTVIVPYSGEAKCAKEANLAYRRQ